MFVGHYGVSFSAGTRTRIPLWVLFLAVQWLDVLWAPFVLLGIEKVRIVPGITATNPLDLYYMPYTHSLVAALAWSVAGFVVYRLARRGEPTGDALLVGAAVFSHWVLDFLVHRPDLPLYDNTAKVGLGLWNWPAPAFALELALLFGCMAWYLRAARRRARPFVVFAVIMGAVQASVFFGPPPASAGMIAVTALVAYAAYAAVAAWLERRAAARA
jgi:membrane-bound metal-dependent hydrolase YbcI (DUF457 family)